MDEKQEPIKTGDISSGKNTIEITIGENKYIMKRLRAGKFYEALKIYMDMIKEVAPKTPDAGKGEATIDFDKLIVGMFKTWPEKMVEFITVCCSTIDTEEPLTEKKILEEAYPEQITESFRACLKLNNVAKNLKNFAAPIGELGAEAETKK